MPTWSQHQLIQDEKAALFIQSEQNGHANKKRYTMQPAETEKECDEI
jgi:hypothetical protein